MSLQSSVARIAHQVHLPDDTLTLKLDGYAFIRNRCRELRADAFETRILLQRTVCMLGRDAAQVFHDGDLVQREGAAPMLTSMLTPDAARRLCELFEISTLGALPRWADRVVLLDEAQDALCRAACAWAGITLDDERRVRDLAATGRVGRARAEWWVEKQIGRVRAGNLATTGALAEIAASDLDASAAAMELLNVIRPTIAVARYVTFAALALYEFPHTEELVRDETTLEPFVAELRRYYPFAPPLAGRARRAFGIDGVEVREGDRVLFDVYGTNHDSRLWDRPEEFHPERFVGRGFDVDDTLTVEVVKTAVRFLTRRISYELPPQDLTVSLSRIPA